MDEARRCKCSAEAHEAGEADSVAGGLCSTQSHKTGYHATDIDILRSS